ncbi:hypothetical protein G6F43_009880 [Rhizopus delemar]|nr:hypothetical protein G6F43_009880 [Rhizopus delemar]
MASNLHKLNASWTDHSMLSVTCCVGTAPSGPGLWRGNPILARKPAFQQYLQHHLTEILSKISSGMNVQMAWDFIKRQVKKVTRTYAIDYTNWRTKSIRLLQSNRNKFLHNKPPLAVRLQRLPILDQQIASLQQELTEILALKANVRWQEEGEASIKYLKNMYRQRIVEQHITTLRTDDSADPVEDVDQLLSVTHQFYQSLYTADPVDDGQLDAHLNDIQDPPWLTLVQCDGPLAPITIEEIIHETARIENKVSSPGEDGLGYAFLYQLFRYPLPSLQDMVLKVYNDALCSNTFPPSWQDLRVRLLAKKAMEHTQRCKREDIALLLDQEKAYDSVHHFYLKKVSLKFGLSPTLVNSLIALFFGNRVCININGHFTNEVDQVAAFVKETHFRLCYASIVGFSFSPLSQDLPPPATLKVLAYTDDVCVFLSSRTDFLRPQHHLNAYGQVSNAKVNLSKTETILLNGRPPPIGNSY